MSETPCARCDRPADPGVCCSAHMAALCHRCYRLTHFVDMCFAGCRDCEREGLDPMRRPE